MGNACCRAGGGSAVVLTNGRSREEFRAADADRNGRVSREELAGYVANHSELWAMLGANLNLGEERCREIAADVAFDLAVAGGKGGGGDERELTEKEFHAFRERYVLDPQGSREFFHRAVFAAFDANGDGVLEPDEVDAFLDTFYEAGSIFRGDARLPEKSELRRLVYDRLDENKDGVLSFEEIRALISGSADLGSPRVDSTPTRPRQ